MDLRGALWTRFGIEKYFVRGLVVAAVVIVACVFAVRAFFSWLGGA